MQDESKNGDGMQDARNFNEGMRSCGVTRANRKPKSTSSHEPTLNQPRIESIFFLFRKKK